MAEFTLREMVSALGVHPMEPVADRIFTGISTDTRSIKPGNLYVALKGDRFDGHAFLHQAAIAGASGLVVESATAGDIPTGIAVFKVHDTRRAYQSIARFHRQRFTIPVIAVTGSNGKTTTKDLTAATLSAQFSVLKTEANFNNEIGLPQTLLRLNTNHEAAVVEMGMRGLGEIRDLARIAMPTIGIVTNVGETHIELLGSMDNIAKAKGELIEALPEDGLAVLNADSPYVRAMAAQAHCRTILYGIEQEADVRAVALHTTEEGTEFRCILFGQCFQAQVPAPGRHNVYNALAAIAVADYLGLSHAQICCGLKLFVPSPMRLAITRQNGFTIINDSYNASPLSMIAAIDTMADTASGRKAAVLGDMLELGDAAVEAHRRIGRHLAARGVNVLVVVGQLAAEIAEAARGAGVTSVVSCQTHQEALTAMRELLQPGDTVLVKGSRGMKMEQMLAAFDPAR